MDTIVDTIKESLFKESFFKKSFFKQSFFSEEIVDSEVIDVLIKYRTNYRKLQKRLLQFNFGGVSDIICKSVSQVIKNQMDENNETVAEFREKNTRLIRKTKNLQLQNDSLIQKNQSLDLENAKLVAEKNSLIQMKSALENDIKLIRKLNDELLQKNTDLNNSKDILMSQIEIADQMKATLQSQNEILQKRITDLEKELSKPVSIIPNITVPLQIIGI